MNVAKFPKAGDRVKLIKVCYLLILKVHHHSFFLCLCSTIVSVIGILLCVSINPQVVCDCLWATSFSDEVPFLVEPLLSSLVSSDPFLTVAMTLSIHAFFIS